MYTPVISFMLADVSSKLLMHEQIFIAGATFAFDGQKALFEDLDFGIDMASRSEYLVLINVFLCC